MGSVNSKKIRKATLGKSRTLAFRRRRLSDADIDALCHTLACDTNRVVSLELNGTGVGIKGLGQIASALQSPACRVTRLCIFNETIGPEGARLLASLIAPAKRPLMSLIMENNILSSEGAVIIAEAIKRPGNRLHILYLLRNHIGYDGIVAIASALKHENNRVAELSLTGNYLGLDGLSELAQAIKHPNNKLEYLRIGRSRIDNRGACILAKALVSDFAQIRSLDLESNLVSDTRDLTRAMKLSKLQWVDLSLNVDNPYEQTKMFCDIRLIFFEKRRFWSSILAMCCARDVPSNYAKFLEQYSNMNKPEAPRADSGRVHLLGESAKIIPYKCKPQLCYLCLLPKDLIKMIADIIYPWQRTEKMLAGFVY